LQTPETNSTKRTNGAAVARGRLLAIDVGAKRVGVAVSDELRIAVRPLSVILRGSWKRLLREIAGLIEEYEAAALVIGFPLRLDGTEGSAAAEARAMSEKLRKSLSVPVYLQDERLTTFAAERELKAAGHDLSSADSEAAAIILRDFINQGSEC
jgi:putative Holliday junction resolvase